MYDDRITLKLISVTSKELKLDFETVIEALGSHLIKFLSLNGYEKILKSLGTNLHDFLAYTDSLHEHLNHFFVGMKSPSFRVTHSKDGSMRLFYHSQRKGLAPFVKGLITTASQELFRTEVIVNIISMENDIVQFEIINKSIDPNSDAFEKIKTPLTDSTLSTSPKSLFFSVETLCETLPFHFIFRRNFRIVQIGNSLKRYLNKDYIKNTKSNKLMFSDLFIISRPIIELNFETIILFSNHLFVLINRDEYIKETGKKSPNSPRKFSLSESTPKQNPRLQLKGQMISLPVYDSILFVGSPKIFSIQDMIDLDLTMSDFPISDVTGRCILLRSIHRNDIELIKKYDVAANHLKIVEKKLRLEISKNHKILHEIFPAKIARILCQSIKVDAEYFEHVTCLYSDIVNFTAMCSCSSLKAIDIVRLLNRLYIQFDNQTNYYGTFKVETVGDAYVVISGVPESIDDHADRVVEMGLAMVHVTRTIISPKDGKHIEMRIGIHSGPCMAGIVGLSMPRYAVFGRTITMANKMEFAGPQGMVHISEATKNYLKKDKYYFVEANVQHLFDFPTYIVTKLYEEYHEDYLVIENNLNMSGGLFKSPSQSPIHKAKNIQSTSQMNYSQIDFRRGKLLKDFDNDPIIPSIQIND
ncbi:guanylate cyclase soluble subunit beta-1-like [Dermatophagoides farinae]|nr:guanylate cyclase soluble subunit beta-1-like [Dermatophagoides farinae]